MVVEWFTPVMRVLERRSTRSLHSLHNMEIRFMYIDSSHSLLVYQIYGENNADSKLYCKHS
jgi:hypothetical protein